MVGVLISLRLRMLSHSLTDARAATMILGGSAGLVLAVGTLVLIATGIVPEALRDDLFALVLACWLFGWIVGPIYAGGGGDQSLRPEQFALLPIAPLRLAFGLLVAGFVGIAPAVSLLAFTSMGVYAADHGAAGVAVSVVAIALQLVLVVVVSRLVVALLSLIIRSQLGAILSALINAGLTVLLNQAWVVIYAATESELFTYGFPPRFATVVAWLPSTWGLNAIDAAGRGDWLLVVAALGGLVVLIVGALAVWARLLVRRTTTRSTQLVPKGSRRSGTLLGRLADRGPVGLVAAKELRTWSRDLMRVHLFWFSVFFGVLYTMIPLLVDWRGMLPWTGLLVAAMAAATSANLFGLDGTTLWLTLVDPGNERAEVRGRQLAWVIQVAPITLALTVAGTIAGGTALVWPWVLALLAALVGGGAGVIALLSVYNLIPVLEPTRRSGNPLEAGPDFGQVLLALVLTAFAAAPTIGVAWLGTRLDLLVVTWAAVPVGLVTGAWLTYWGGRQAAKRLGATGPELLSAMRSGVAIPFLSRSGTPMPELPKTLSWTVAFLWTACWIPLFPQGLVPLVFILNGSETRSWFAAMYVDDPWRIPVAVAFALLGVGMIAAATVIQVRAARRSRAEVVAE